MSAIVAIFAQLLMPLHVTLPILAKITSVLHESSAKHCNTLIWVAVTLFAQLEFPIQYILVTLLNNKL